MKEELKYIITGMSKKDSVRKLIYCGIDKDVAKQAVIMIEDRMNKMGLACEVSPEWTTGLNLRVISDPDVDFALRLVEFAKADIIVLSHAFGLRLLPAVWILIQNLRK